MSGSSFAEMVTRCVSSSGNTSPTCLNCLQCCKVVLPEVNKQEKLEHSFFFGWAMRMSCNVDIVYGDKWRVGGPHVRCVAVWLWANDGLIQQIEFGLILRDALIWVELITQCHAPLPNLMR